MAVKQADISVVETGTGWRPLAEMEQEHLHTRAAIPFRDPTGEDEAEVILMRRNTEQQHCGLETTNAWQHRWAAK
jgi:tRNA U34 5-methylaminomethyl-2-thiouridine-forming methyltransferase MnmC